MYLLFLPPNLGKILFLPSSLGGKNFQFFDRYFFNATKNPTFDFQNVVRRYLDPKNIPTPSEEVFGRLGEVSFHDSRVDQRFWNFEPIEGIEDLNPDAVMQACGVVAALYNIQVH